MSDSSVARRRDCNEVNFFLGRMIQYLLNLIPVTNMGIDVKPLGFETFLHAMKIFLCLADNLHLGFCLIRARECMC
jgi:hypothetical protein